MPYPEPDRDRDLKILAGKDPDRPDRINVAVNWTELYFRLGLITHIESVYIVSRLQALDYLERLKNHNFLTSSFRLIKLSFSYINIIINMLDTPETPKGNLFEKFKNRFAPVKPAENVAPETHTGPNALGAIEIRVGQQKIAAEPVLPEAAALREQKQKVSLETMKQLEAARSHLGEFCLTLGQGENRAIMLIAPTREQIRSGYACDWYTVFTRYGIRRFSIVSEVTEKAGGFDEDTRKDYLASYSLFLKELEKAREVQLVGGVNKNTGYTEIERDITRGIATEGTLQLSDGSRIISIFTPYSIIRIEINEDRVTDALRRSIALAQTEPKAQILSDRATMNTLAKVSSVLSGTRGN
ncbi:hypothetical protein A2774_05395 [Candidatus Roizmanbacteria bacterium RIFCSPHIGHO2_01_FULL_39_12c]|uniref:Uncharacterized protein n=1 Tax=Candidatus Roizmanbacteria bacterium RIFCSPHIGHO2_01_FULL_39_12c TaxID=1802031 RepID=A0A1F7GD54_9BACT|nr:MAG: hypothetical protein A2774_05395 [Candidatus Roizmanbacteria bacterium RIFCSPHIGHO2_01_FULL_39_12c]